MSVRTVTVVRVALITLVVSTSVVIAALALSPVWTTSNPEVNGIGYGHAVAAAGDVNGDGFGDLIVGAYAYPSFFVTQGRAYVFQGTSTGASTTAAWTTTGTDGADTYGEAVAGAGDVNNDGYDDVIVGAQHAGATNGGRAYVFHGSATGLSLTADWSNPDTEPDGAEYGESVASAGDVNGDGYDDVVVGSPYNGSALSGGKAFVYFGSATGLSTTPDWSFETDAEFAGFGDVVAGAGDVNDDGYDDILVGAPGYPGADTFPAGAAFVFFGSASGPSATPDWSALAPPNSPNHPFPQGSFFGYAVAIAGDLNGDGYDDVAMGQDFSGSQNQQGEGKVYIYYGSATGPGTTAGKEIESNKGNSFFGQAISGADVNGDGFSDLIVGAPRYASTMMQADEGALFVYYGSSSGPITGAKKFTRIEGNEAGALLAQSVGAGDINDDGGADVIVGAPTNGTLPASSERAHLFLGAPGLP